MRVPKTETWVGSAPTVLVFDVNETLLDIESLSPLFEATFGDERVLREWFGNLITYSMTYTLASLYEDFWELGRGVFRMVGEIHGVAISEEQVEALEVGMKTLPAHADSEAGLNALADAGFRLVTLTNSPPTPGRTSPLENAQLYRYFERQFNTQAARAYKPASGVYHMVAQELGVLPRECCMVAAHVWDTIGAQSVGMAGALLTRAGNAPLRTGGLPQPHVIGADMPTVAHEIIRLWGR
jgi:2-haloacid dehalogenase